MIYDKQIHVRELLQNKSHVKFLQYKKNEQLIMFFIKIFNIHNFFSYDIT